MKRIYLDYASLTPIDPRVTAEIKKYSAIGYANPSSLYKEGVAALEVLKDCRKKVASFLHALPNEIIFTSGGTEANGLAIEGARRAAHRNEFVKPHLIISNIEHSSIMEVANMMEKHGVEITRIPVGTNGLVSVGDIKKALRPETFMVSIMYVNNEIGTVQPIREIAKVIRQYRKEFGNRGRTFALGSQGSTSVSSKYPLFHTDAAQAALFQDINVDNLGVDMLTLDSGKVYGPRGIGCLYVKRETPIEPIIYGGGQEGGLRSGTENVASIAGFAKALELVQKENKNGKEVKRISELKEYFSKELQKIRPDIIFNPVVTKITPHILNVAIPNIDNEFLLFQLDAKGIAVSTKSSCLRNEDESYVLKAIGADNKTSIRFSFGRWTKKNDIRQTLRIIKKYLQFLYSSVIISPMLMIRLQRTGRNHEPTFRVVLTDSKNGPKSGKYLENLGWYDTRIKNKIDQMDTEKIKHWMSHGVKLSLTLHNYLVTQKVIAGKKLNALPKKTLIKKEDIVSTSTPTPVVAVPAEAPVA